MKQSIEVMKNALISVIGEKITAIYIYGSVASGDFKPGWSDIDILCLTNGNLTAAEAEKLLMLRQKLLREQVGGYYRSFEGTIVPLSDFVSGSYTRLVYWGTSGQRITDKYDFDAFSMYELIKQGILIHGGDIRDRLTPPTYADLRAAVIRHYETIRKYAVNTNESLYSCGWLLDISRGIYTLRTGGVIAKTAAGEWALAEQICPVPEQLEKTLLIRKNPAEYKDNPEIRLWLASLGGYVQKYADILEAEINRTART